MAKEIVAWCDVHLADDERVVAKTLGVALRHDTKGVDLCDTCTKTLVEPLAEIIEEYGQRFETNAPPAPRAQPRGTMGKTHQCEVCQKWYTGKASLNTHMRDQHPEEYANRDLPYKCGEGDCPMSFDTPQAVGAHRRSVHGIVGEYAKDAPAQGGALTLPGNEETASG